MVVRSTSSKLQLHDSHGFVMQTSAVAYTRGEGGAELLLSRSAGGHSSLDVKFASALGQQTGDVGLLHLSAKVLSKATGTLLAPSGGDGLAAEEHLLAKLKGGKGVHELRTASHCLFLVPTRRAIPPVGGGLEWVSVQDVLTLATADAPIAAALLELIRTPASQMLLQRLAAPPQTKPQAAPVETAVEEVPEEVPAEVPRRVATDIFIGEEASALNEELLGALSVSHLLLFTQTTSADPDNPAAPPVNAPADIAKMSDIARRLNATLAVVDAGEGIRSGDAQVVLHESCRLIRAGLSMVGGVVLLAGPMSGSGRIGPAWAVCAHLASTGEKSVPAAFALCRKFFPRCWVSSQLAADAQAVGAALRREKAAESVVRKDWRETISDSDNEDDDPDDQTYQGKATPQTKPSRNGERTEQAPPVDRLSGRWVRQVQPVPKTSEVQRTGGVPLPTGRAAEARPARMPLPPGLSIRYAAAAESSASAPLPEGRRPFVPLPEMRGPSAECEGEGGSSGRDSKAAACAATPRAVAVGGAAGGAAGETAGETARGTAGEAAGGQSDSRRGETGATGATGGREPFPAVQAPRTEPAARAPPSSPLAVDLESHSAVCIGGAHNTVPLSMDQAASLTGSSGGTSRSVAQAPVACVATAADQRDAVAWAVGGIASKAGGGEEVVVVGGGAGAQAPPSPTGPAIWYRCRKCRGALFPKSSLVDHEVGGGQVSSLPPRPLNRSVNSNPIQARPIPSYLTPSRPTPYLYPYPYPYPYYTIPYHTVPYHTIPPHPIPSPTPPEPNPNTTQPHHAPPLPTPPNPTPPRPPSPRVPLTGPVRDTPLSALGIFPLAQARGGEERGGCLLLLLVY